MKRLRVLLTIIFLFFLSSCANLIPTPAQEEPSLGFLPRMKMDEAGQMQVKLGIQNRANREQPALMDVNIRVGISDQGGTIRNELLVVDLGPIEPDETVFPLTYEGKYDEGTYRMTLSAEVIPTMYVNFAIREQEGTLILAAPPEVIDPHTEFTVDDPELGEY